jgi:hypothetical protein
MVSFVGRFGLTAAGTLFPGKVIVNKQSKTKGSASPLNRFLHGIVGGGLLSLVERLVRYWPNVADELLGGFIVETVFATGNPVRWQATISMLISALAIGVLFHYAGPVSRLPARKCAPGNQSESDVLITWKVGVVLTTIIMTGNTWLVLPVEAAWEVSNWVLTVLSLLSAFAVISLMRHVGQPWQPSAIVLGVLLLLTIYFTYPETPQASPLPEISQSATPLASPPPTISVTLPPPVRVDWPSAPSTITPIPTVVPAATTTPLAEPKATSVAACPPLYLPTTFPTGAQVLVKPGDSIFSIARDWGISEQALIAANAPYYPTLLIRPDCIRTEWRFIVPMVR